MTERPDYGNWISRKMISITGLLTILFTATSMVIPLVGVVAAFFFLSLAYIAYARYRFSLTGGDIQAKIQGLVVEYLEWDGEGKAIDVGCGNGAVTMMVAKKHPKARVIGVDYWGGAWEYSKSVCERNAEIEGVVGRIGFQKASASALPFDDESFDAAVSNLTFHEVRDAEDKRDVIKEALRVVRKGGTFCFQDLFLWNRMYGEMDDLLDTIRRWGVERVEFVETSNVEFIPSALKLPFMVGTIGILRGKK